MERPVRIALVLDKNRTYWRAILRGIISFAHQRPGWILHTVPSLDPQHQQALARWHPRGIIANVVSETMETDLIRLGIPAVSVSNALSATRLPRVGPDDVAVGALAARHFLDRGISNFAYAGQDALEYCHLQLRGYQAAILASGCNATVHERPHFPPAGSEGWIGAEEVLERWILSLPRPLGLMLYDDDWGLWFTQICHTLGLRVPDDVAIVGVNDDPLNCDLATPPLSSVAIPLERIGHEAATLLDQMLQGAAPAAGTSSALLIPPKGVTVRASSDVLAISDADLLAAMRFIESASHRPISVDDLLAAVPVSRRVLERKFSQSLGRTPLQQIRHAHLERARRLLAYTDAPLEQVAERSGFGSVYHLCRIFRRETGLTAMSYRKQFRLR